MAGDSQSGSAPLAGHVLVWEAPHARAVSEDCQPARGVGREQRLAAYQILRPLAFRFCIKQSISHLALTHPLGRKPKQAAHGGACHLPTLEIPCPQIAAHSSQANDVNTASASWPEWSDWKSVRCWRLLCQATSLS